MKHFYVYIHVTPSGKRYVGITTRPVNRRWQNGFGYYGNKHFFNAIKKYGWDNIEHKVYEVDTKNEMYYLENYLITYYQTNKKEYGYNKSVGGEKNSLGAHFQHSEETKLKIGRSNKGLVRSEELKKRWSETCKGRKISEETKRKMSESRKGLGGIPCEVDGIRFKSYTDAANYLGVYEGSISKAINRGACMYKGHRINKIEQK